MGVYLKHFTSRNPQGIEMFLNTLVDTTILGAPVWDGKKWTVWVLTKNRKIPSGKVD